MPNSLNTVAPISPLLTNVAVGYENLMFVAEEVLPVVNVATEKYTYYVFGRHHFRRYNTKRNFSSGFQRVDYAASTKTSRLQQFGLEHPIDDRLKDEAQAPLQPAVQGTYIVTEGLRLDYEKRVATLVTTSGNYATGMTATPSVKWDTITATIHSDITAGMEAVRQKIGVYPNKIIIPSTVARYMSLANDITDYVKQWSGGGLGAIERATAAEGYLLPKNLWGLKTVIAGAVENTANLAQAESMADIWSDFVLLAYIPQQPQLWKPSFGYTFRKNGAAVKISRYREEKITSDIVRGQFIQEEKLLALDDSSKAIAGYLLTNVLASV